MVSDELLIIDFLMGVVSSYVLEHLSNPNNFLDDVSRVITNDGYIYVPSDYHRITIESGY